MKKSSGCEKSSEIAQHVLTVEEEKSKELACEAYAKSICTSSNKYNYIENLILVQIEC